MSKGLAVTAPVTSASLMSARLVFTVGLNYSASISTIYLLSAMYISPTALLMSGRWGSPRSLKKIIV